MSQKPENVHVEILVDYDKLTVVEIRKLFKDRHIPTTGLTRKQQLIDRLREQDASAAHNVDEQSGVPSAEQEVDKSALNDPIADEFAATDLGSAKEDTAFATLDAKNAGGTQRRQSPFSSEVEATVMMASTSAPAAAQEYPPVNLESTHGETQFQSVEPVIIEPAVTDPLFSHDVAIPSKEEPLRMTSWSPQPIVNAPRIGSPTTDESRKRKRRSATPSVSASEAIQKKLKQDGEGGIVHLKEDEASPIEEQNEVELKLDVVLEEHAMVTSNVASRDLNQTALMTPEVEVQFKPEVAIQDNDTVKNSASAGKVEGPEVPTSIHMKLNVTKTNSPLRTESGQPLSPVTKPVSPQSTLKQQTGKDHRYKDLFSNSPASNLHQSLDITLDTPYEDAEDRTITPATHPATSALYIRDFMRPLQPGALKDHLIMLAHPPSKQNDPDAPVIESTVLEFHLDAIRTHCFVVFSSVSAAARVRNALHERVWPAERTRKPLWVDFIPEDKVKLWIDMELNAGGSGRGGTGKRWEVFYRQDERETVIAELQEASAVPTGPRLSVGMGPNSAPMNELLPTPEIRKEPPPVNGNPTGTPASFLALDQLFKSTTTKPKLYFLPISRELAEKRLVELGARSSKRNTVPSGGSGYADSRRYTFEKGDHLVDNGPEFGLRRERGDSGFRGRGGYGLPRGSFRGRY